MENAKVRALRPPNRSIAQLWRLASEGSTENAKVGGQARENGLWWA
jgi:hypothetical protein